MIQHVLDPCKSFAHHCHAMRGKGREKEHATPAALLSSDHKRMYVCLVVLIHGCWIRECVILSMCKALLTSLDVDAKVRLLDTYTHTSMCTHAHIPIQSSPCVYMHIRMDLRSGCTYSRSTVCSLCTLFGFCLNHTAIGVVRYSQTTVEITSLLSIP